MRVFSYLLVAVVMVSTLTQLGAQDFDGGVTETLQSIYIPPVVRAPFSATVHTEWVREIPGGRNLYGHQSEARRPRQERADLRGTMVAGAEGLGH